MQFGEEIKKLHKLTEEEKEFLIKDYTKLQTLEKEEESELTAVRHFEKKLQSLIENVVYLEGYIDQIENGQEMLRINASVKELGMRLAGNIKEVEALSSTLLSQEKKMLGLAKHVNQILSKAKKFERIIFG